MGSKTNESWLNCLSYNVNNPGKNLDGVSKFLTQKKKMAQKKKKKTFGKKTKKVKWWGYLFMTFLESYIHELAIRNSNSFQFVTWRPSFLKFLGHHFFQKHFDIKNIYENQV